MADLKSMRMSEKERKAQYGGEPSIASADLPVYPYGLSITLNEEALAKLGIEDDLPTVDKPLMLVAMVDVTGVNSNEQKGGEKGTHKHRSVTLQITDLCLEDAPTSKKKSASELLYESAEK